MIRKFKSTDTERVMEIWLNSNTDAHNFIEKTYWEKNFQTVKNMLPHAEIYVYNEEEKIKGFIGLTENYIAGIFVEKDFRGRGIGKRLIDYVKNIKDNLILNVYEKNISAVKFYEKENFIVEKFGIDENTGEKEFVMIWKK